jgi:hypothetical protein
MIEYVGKDIRDVSHAKQSDKYVIYYNGLDALDRDLVDLVCNFVQVDTIPALFQNFSVT